jgi:glutaminyl-tRNA synthetase
VIRHDLDPYVDAVVGAGGDAGLAVRRLANEVAARMECIDRLTAPSFARLVALEGEGSLTTAQARDVLARLLESGGDPESVAAELGYEAMAAGDLEALVDGVIRAHPGEWARYVAGEDKLSGFFIGRIKSASDGKADLKVVPSMLRSRREAAVPD